MGDVFYVDLVENEIKEAIVFLWQTNCGGSCDGGGIILHFYKLENGKGKLIDFLETGSRSGGCFVKNFRVEKKTIFIEQFGKCKKNTNFYSDKAFMCKFCISGFTSSVYSIKNSKLFREYVEETDTESKNINNYLPEISINE